MIQQGWQSCTVAGYGVVSKIHYIILQQSPEIFATYEQAKTFEGESTGSLSEDIWRGKADHFFLSAPGIRSPGETDARKKLQGGKKWYKIVVEGTFLSNSVVSKKHPKPQLCSFALLTCRSKCPPALHCLGTSDMSALSTSWSVAQLMLSGIHPSDPMVKRNWSQQGQKLQSDSSCDLPFVSTPTQWIPSQGLWQRLCTGELFCGNSKCLQWEGSPAPAAVC